LEEKQRVIEAFAAYSQPAKARVWSEYGMPLVLGRREGPFMWDMDGGPPLINLHTNGGTYNLGHRHPEIIRTVRQALDELDIGNGHLISRPRAELAEMLAGLMPGDLRYTIFGVSGGEAVDLALKVARGHTGRTRIISARGGYHGHTGLAMAAGDPRYRDLFGPQPPGFAQVPFADLASMDAAVDDDTAAVILETIPATLGMPVPPPDYYPQLREMCDRRGALLILDEVQTGFGRTGRLWAFEHFGIVPDVVVLGKGSSGGIYPITATVLREPLIRVFDLEPFAHVSTFGGAEIGCRVMQKVLEISSAPGFLDHVNRLAAVFAEGVDALRRKHPGLLVRLRQLGLFMGLEMADEWSALLVLSSAYRNGLFMVYANNDKRVCQFLPPLNIPLELAREILDRLDRSLAAAGELAGGSAPPPEVSGSR